MLTKTELLFIRACKVEDSTKRINSVYTRFYGWTNPTSPLGKMAIFHILCRIVDRICPYTAVEAFSVYSKHELFVVPTLNPEQYLDKVLSDLITRIALTAVADIEGYIPPAKYRKRYG